MVWGSAMVSLDPADSNSDAIYTTVSFWALHSWGSFWRTYKSVSNSRVEWKHWAIWNVKTTNSDFSKVPFRKMRRPSWCLPLKTEAHHVTLAMQKLEMLRCQCEKVTNRSVRWSRGAAKEEINRQGKELPGLIVEKIYRLITSVMSWERMRLELTISKKQDFF